MGLEKDRCSGDSGAAMVEFALVAPVLVLILFGIMESGWLFSQNLGVRHGAREGSRLVAVNYNPDNEVTANAQAADIVTAICQRMDVTDNDMAITMTVTDTSVANPSGAGRFARVTVSTPVQQITGLFSTVLDPVTLRSTVETRLERRATWAVAGNSFTYSGHC